MVPSSLIKTTALSSNLMYEPLSLAIPLFVLTITAFKT
ncbi:Uncharacterised protein [Chlamydia trachomatis]|nr:Uncharacterised protein [Chlamydia trachomatis]CRH46651.1 Uncharacterised protein [Chlamydia trachomatis]